MRAAIELAEKIDTGSRWELSMEATLKLRDCFDRPGEWHTVDAMNFDQASDLLDWLENQSISQREVKYQDNGTLTGALGGVIVRRAGSVSDRSL